MTNTLPAIDSLWAFNDPATSETRFRELLPVAERAGDIDYLAQALTQLARSLALQHKFEEAHRELDSASELLAHANQTTHVRYLLERGRTFNSSGAKDVARELFIEAFEIARASGFDYFAIDAAHMVAITESLDAAFRWNETAKSLAEATDDERARSWLGVMYNNFGWVYHERGEFARALESFEKCLAWHRERNNRERERIARWSIARTLRSLGRVDEALQWQQELMEEITALGAPQDGFVFEEIAECLLLQERGEEARSYFADAYELLSKNIWLVRDEPERIDRIRRLAATEANGTSQLT